MAIPLICLLAAASPALAKPPARPAAVRPVPAAVAQQLAVVERERHRQTWRAYPDALFELARRYRTANRLAEALATAEQAAAAYDRQLELHHDLSEALSDPVRGRLERTAARELGLARDEARFWAAGVAEQQGRLDDAVNDYLLVVRSQPGEGRGLDAMAALKALGWLASPPPSAGPAGKP